MSTTDKVVNEKLVNAQPSEEVKTVNSIFAERDKKIPEDEEKEIKKEPKEAPLKKATEDVKAKTEQKISPKRIDNQSEVKEKEEEVSKEVTEKEPEHEDERDIEISKLKKALADNQKWGHTNNKRLKSVSKAIAELKEQGALKDDEFGNISQLLQSDPVEDEKNMPQVNENPLTRLIHTAAKRLPDLEALYDEDPLYREKLKAFDFYVNNASEKESDEIYEELKDFEKNELKLAQRIFKIGENFYNEGYKDLQEAGGLKEFMSSKESEIKKLKQKIDKLEKNMLESKDYDKPTYKISEMSESEKLVEGKPGKVTDRIFEARDRKQKVPGY